MESVKLSYPLKLSAPRWFYDETEKKGLKGIPLHLMKMRSFELDKKAESCLSEGAKLRKLSSALVPWLLVSEIRCANLIKDQKARLKVLSDLETKIQAKQEFLYQGPQVEQLREAYLDLLNEKLSSLSRSNRPAAWKLVDRLQSLSGWMNISQRARFFKLAGELAFVEQKISVAVSFFQKSLSQQSDRDLKNRMDALMKTLPGSLSQAASVPASPSAQSLDEDLGVSESEKKLLSRMREALKSGDVLAAVEDGVALIQKFPGGIRAEWASDRILEIYLGVIGKEVEEYKLFRKRVVDAMKGADGSRIYRWANNAYARGQYTEAMVLAEASFNKLKGHPDSTKSLALVGQAALANGSYNEAMKSFESLTVEHFGSPESIEALFRMGLLHFRKGDYGSAAAFFERLLVLPRSQDYEYRAFYWHWRSLQKSNSSFAEESLKRLVQRYPVTYYGLKARAEMNAGLLTWDTKEQVKVQTELWLTQNESQSWERIKLLLSGGWFAEARLEILSWASPQTAEEKLIRADLFAKAFDYGRTADYLNQIWEERTDLVSYPVLRLGFPQEFSGYVNKYAKAQSVDPHLVWSLMRQESAFQVKAQSTSNARGLMQLIPGTGQETFNMLKLKGRWDPERLYEPELNIQMGSHYLARMIRAFKGQTPLALASYNAGIGRMRRWISSRPELSQVETLPALSIETDLWVDELPWSETSFYVKAVLRNLLLYKSLESGTLKVDDSILAQ